MTYHAAIPRRGTASIPGSPESPAIQYIPRRVDRSAGMVGISLEPQRAVRCTAAIFVISLQDKSRFKKPYTPAPFALPRRCVHTPPPRAALVQVRIHRKGERIYPSSR